MPSTAGHPDKGFGLFVVRTVSNDETIRAYYDPLVYTDLSKQCLLMKEYGKETLTVLISTFKPFLLVLPT